MRRCVLDNKILAIRKYALTTYDGVCWTVPDPRGHVRCLRGSKWILAVMYKDSGRGCQDVEVVVVGDGEVPHITRLGCGHAPADDADCVPARGA